MKKVIALLLTLCLCMTAAAALATGENGENVSVGNGTTKNYGQSQYTELKKGEVLLGTKLEAKVTEGLAANITAITADTTITKWEVEGLDNKTYAVLPTLSATEQGSLMAYLLGFYTGVADTDLPADIAAAKAIAEANGLTVNATTTSTMITYEGKEAELRTISYVITKADGTSASMNFNYIRYTGETEWILVAANEAAQ